MIHPKLLVDAVVSHPYEENTFIVRRPQATKCLVIDPGFEPAKVFAFLDDHGLQPDAILNTHGHSDHIAGNGAMKSRWPDCPLVIGHAETGKLSDPRQNLSAGYGLARKSPEADRIVREGDTIEFAGLQLSVRETPGHSAGHVVFVWQQEPPTVVFGGDVLFAGSVGRSDFFDGSFPQLVASIHEKMFTLPPDTIVFTGHGPATTVGDEMRTNPFVGTPAGYRFGE